MISDPHDPREFRQWVTLDDQGHVLAVHEFAAGVEQPLPTVVEVTHLGKRDFTKLDAETLAPLRRQRADLVTKDAARKAAEPTVEAVKDPK